MSIRQHSQRANSVTPVFWGRHIHRALHLLTKAVRSRRIYSANNATYTRMMRDLIYALEAVLVDTPVIDLRVRIDGLFYQDTCVLTSEADEDSLGSIIYRDGIRRLIFYKGIEPWELEVLVSAVAATSVGGELQEDTVTYLWQHHLEHIQYVVVETVMTTEASHGSSPRDPLESAIDGLLNEIYGAEESESHMTSFSLDSSDISAKDIAQSLASVDEMAPGFHPQQRYTVAPAYGNELLESLIGEDNYRVGLRATETIVSILQEKSLTSTNRRSLYHALLTVYDASLVEHGQMPLASKIIQHVQNCPQSAERTDWLHEALAETRLRQASQHLTSAASTDVQSVLSYYRTCGPVAADVIVSALPTVEAESKRIFSELVIELGGGNLERIGQLLQSGNSPLIHEAIYIYAHHPNPSAQRILAGIEFHSSPLARIALLETSQWFGEIDTVGLGMRLFNDPEPSVRICALQHLSRLPCRRVINFLEEYISKPDFEAETSEVKREVLSGFMMINPVRAVPILEGFIQRGSRFFASKRLENSAIQAIHALRTSKSAPRVNTLLTQATHTYNRRIRAAAMSVLDGTWSSP